jgi:hypothetical protein
MSEKTQGKVNVEVTLSSEEFGYVTEQTELYGFSSATDFIIALIMFDMREKGFVPLTK